jgi:hypothetical protein
MQALHGSIEKGYRVRVDVPTTIYDNNQGRVVAYEGREVVDMSYFHCKSMPKWSVSLQTIILSRDSEKEMKKAVNAVLRRLPDVTERNHVYVGNLLRGANAEIGFKFLFRGQGPHKFKGLKKVARLKDNI